MWVKQLYFDGLYHKNCDDWGMIILLIIPRCTGNFFSCDSTSANKNAKSGKNHQKMDVARLGFRKTNVGARKAGLVT